METVEKLSLRVYGCCVLHGKVLLLKEKYAGETLLKFPGGGLELGEGMQDCLKREIKEELGIEVGILQPIYTVDYFLQSKFHPDTQIILLYYRIVLLNDASIQPLEPDTEIFWQELNVSENPMSLKSDRHVFELLSKENNRQ